MEAPGPALYSTRPNHRAPKRASVAVCSQTQSETEVEEKRTAPPKGGGGALGRSTMGSRARTRQGHAAAALRAALQRKLREPGLAQAAGSRILEATRCAPPPRRHATG